MTLKKTDLVSDQSSVFCAACQPGYYPTTLINNSDWVNNLYIKTCTAIPYCSGLDWFNSCSQCSQGYVYKYDTSLK